jgi:hypothetical protein
MKADRPGDHFRVAPSQPVRGRIGLSATAVDTLKIVSGFQRKPPISQGERALSDNLRQIFAEIFALLGH